MRETWKQIGGTMFDFAPFYQRIADQIQQPKDREIRLCEVGVADGKSAIFLAEALANQGKKFVLYMIDNLDYGKNEQLTEIMTNIQRSGLADNIKFIVSGSLDASCKFNDGYFDFIFIDASHKEQETKADIRLWWRKLIWNGILAGHDATGEENPGVGAAIKQVIPSEFLTIEETEKGYGVWHIQNIGKAYVN